MGELQHENTAWRAPRDAHFLQLVVFDLQVQQRLGHLQLAFFRLDERRLQLRLAPDQLVVLVTELTEALVQLVSVLLQLQLLQVVLDGLPLQLADAEHQVGLLAAHNSAPRTRT